MKKTIAVGKGTSTAKTLAEAHMREYLGRIAELELQIAEFKDLADTTQRKLRKNAKSDRKQLRDTHEAETAALILSHTNSLDAAQKSHKVAMHRAKAAHAKHAKTLANKHQTALATSNSQLHKRLSEQHDNNMTRAKTELDECKRKHAAALEECHNKRESLEAERFDLQRELIRLREESSQREATFLLQQKEARAKDIAAAGSASPTQEAHAHEVESLCDSLKCALKKVESLEDILAATQSSHANRVKIAVDAQTETVETLKAEITHLQRAATASQITWTEQQARIANTYTETLDRLQGEIANLQAQLLAQHTKTSSANQRRRKSVERRAEEKVSIELARQTANEMSSENAQMRIVIQELHTECNSRPVKGELSAMRAAFQSEQRHVVELECAARETEVQMRELAATSARHLDSIARLKIQLSSARSNSHQQALARAETTLSEALQMNKQLRADLAESVRRRIDIDTSARSPEPKSPRDACTYWKALYIGVCDVNASLELEITRLHRSQLGLLSDNDSTIDMAVEWDLAHVAAHACN